MLRAFFLAAGGILVFTGVEALLLDHAVLYPDSILGKSVEKSEPVLDEWGFEVGRKIVQPAKKTIRPPEWAPWSMMSSGTITMLYALMGGRSGGGHRGGDDDDD